MTAEYLLEAIGLIDDDLIRDAEAPVRRRPASVCQKQWGALAACLALVAALGYGATHLPVTSGSSNSAAPAASAGASEPCSSGSWDAASGGSASSASAAEPGAADITRSASIFTAGGEYRLTGEVRDALPEDAQALEALSGLYPDTPYPATDAEEYVGCALFEGPDGRLYVQLPDGGYAVAEPVQP